MASLAIVDSGYANIASTGTVETYIANSGTAVTLRLATLSVDYTALIDAKPIPGQTGTSNIAVANFNAFENPVWKIDGIFSRRVTADMTALATFKDLYRTRGIKCLYYNSTSDGFRELTDTFGVTDAYTNHPASTPHIHVRVERITINQGAESDIIRYSITLKETA
jgi:hypothetical protein